MADAPSIDEILESLDHLLKEGDERNDDHPGDESEGTVASSGTGGHEDTPVTVRQTDSGETEAHGEWPEPVAEAGSGAQASERKSAGTAEPDGNNALVTDDAGTSQRTILSEAMLVDNPQEQLLFGDGDTVAQQTDTVGGPNSGDEHMHAPPVQARMLDDEEVRDLVRLVSDDLVARLHEQLPGIVEAAIGRQLSRFKSKKTDNA